MGELFTVADLIISASPVAGTSRIVPIISSGIEL